MIWNESIECMDRESLRKIQGIRLKKTVERVYHDTPFYRRKMQELGITPDDINSIDDIVKLPFTTKYDLRDNYPFGLCAVPMSQIVRIHASSGTTGKPTVVGYTRKGVRRGQVGFGLVIVVIGYVIFHCVVREESLELAVELCRQRLVVAQYERRLVNVGYDVGNGECLSGAGHAQQGLCGNSLKHSFGELCDCFRLVAGGAVGGC